MENSMEIVKGKYKWETVIQREHAKGKCKWEIQWKMYTVLENMLNTAILEILKNV